MKHTQSSKSSAHVQYFFCEQMKQCKIISQMKSTYQNSGVVTIISAKCSHSSCKHIWSINPDLRISRTKSMTRETFSLNVMFTLTLYLCSVGRRAIKTMIGLLDFPNSTYMQCLQRCDGKVVIEEVGKVLDNCFEKEVE